MNSLNDSSLVTNNGLSAQEHPVEPGVMHGASRRARAEMARFMSLRDLEAAPRIEWQIEGLVERGSTVVIYGQPGSYKSFLAIDMALSVANGVLFANRSVRQGAVLAVLGEGSLRGHRNRIVAWNQARKGDPGAPFRVLPASVPLTDPRSFGQLLQRIEDAEGEMGRRCELILLDTLTRTFGDGDESNHQHMKGYLEAISRLTEATRATMMIVAHTGKDHERGIRGASVIEGWVDAIYRVKRCAEYPEYVTLTTEKMKDAEESEPMCFEMRRIELADGESSLCPTPAAPPASNKAQPQGGLTRNRRAVLEIVRSAGPSGLAPKEAAVRAKAKGIGASSYHVAKDFLLEEGFIELRDGVFVTTP